MKHSLVIIGDVHGQFDDYFEAIELAEYSIQIGDLAFSYDWLIEANVDPKKHRFFGGNHDNYNLIKNSPYYLGDYGSIEIPNFDKSIFFVRGAWSIDQKYRKENVSWWRDEELSYEQCEEAIETYATHKPDILLSHDCAFGLVPHIVDPTFALDMGCSEPYIQTKTGMMLNKMLEIHKPKTHIFGHHHKFFETMIDDTNFICVTADKRFKKNCRHVILA